jgi:flagellar biosynthetic protein FlhB
MADERGERTEQPTGRRLGEARERGQVPRTAEAGAAVSLLAMGAYLSWGGAAWLEGFGRLLGLALEELRPAPWTPEHALELAGRMLGLFLTLAGPPILVVAAGAALASFVQVGPLFTTRPLEPDWGRLSPLAGLRALFGRHALVELTKAPLKLLLLGAVTWITLRPVLAELVLGAGQNVAATLREVASLVTTLLWRLGLAHAALAAADYGYQRWRHARSLRMTRQEVRDEARQSEGDPRIRARARSLHRQYATRRMFRDVARASVVVTNPTHLAVALRYAPGMGAPRVVAKGARLVADRIREEARRHGVPVIEQPPLARALYKAVPVGGEIPAALYRAVAEVLAYVWSLGGGRPATEPA